MEQILSLTAIRDQKAALNRVIADAQAQIADLDVAERIVQRFGQSAHDPRPKAFEMDDLLQGANIEPKTSEVVKVLVERKLTTKALLQSVMRQADNPWMTAVEIRDRASFIRGGTVSMAVISPALTNMKNDGLIARDGLKVALVERLKENGLQGGYPPRSPETALVAQ